MVILFNARICIELYIYIFLCFLLLLLLLFFVNKFFSCSFCTSRFTCYTHPELHYNIKQLNFDCSFPQWALINNTQGLAPNPEVEIDFGILILLGFFVCLKAARSQHNILVIKKACPTDSPGPKPFFLRIEA